MPVSERDTGIFFYDDGYLCKISNADRVWGTGWSSVNIGECEPACL